MYAFAPSAARGARRLGCRRHQGGAARTSPIPMSGNPIAGLPERDVGVEFMWEIMNRGKRCIGVDVSTAEGQAGARTTSCARADVFVTNLLPDARRPLPRRRRRPRRGAARRRLRAGERPRRRGPRARGAVATTTPTSGPARGIGHAASHGVRRVRAAGRPRVRRSHLRRRSSPAASRRRSFRRERTGRRRGRRRVAAVVGHVGLLAGGGGEPALRHRHHPAVPASRPPNPLVAAYRTADDRHIYLAGVQTEAPLRELLRGRRPALTCSSDPRFADGNGRSPTPADCIAILDEIFAARTSSEWRARPRRADDAVDVVQTARRPPDPQVVANGFVVDVEGTSGTFPLVASPAQFDGAPPTLDRRPTTASTPRRCCSSSVAHGTRSRRSRRAARCCSAGG